MKTVFLPALALLVITPAFVLACRGDDENNDIEAERVEGTLRAAFDAYNRGDLEGFLSHWTDSAIEGEFGMSRRELIEAVGEFRGPPQRVRNILATEVRGRRARSDAEIVLGRGIQVQRFQLVDQEGRWRIDAVEAVQARVPRGTITVQVEMDEFAYRFDAQRAGQADVALRIDNVGEQLHEVVLLRVPADFNLQRALESAEPSMGVETIAAVGPVDPGSETTLLFTERLDPGRYVMVCFLPDERDPKGTPHALLGMTGEFSVGAEGGGR
jgi:hypothetical protein